MDGCQEEGQKIDVAWCLLFWHRNISVTISCLCLTSHKKRNLFEGSIPGEEIMPTGDGQVQHEETRMVLKRRKL